MECGGSGRQSRLLGRLLGKLRGEHRYSALDKNYSFTSAGINESIERGSSTQATDESEPPTQAATSTERFDDVQFAANIDMRYSGQYLTPEQLPEFCNQLHHLVEVIRNIQSYAQVTGEYPSELEKRLEQEAREVASLAAEARNARDVARRAQDQRLALRAERAELVAHLTRLRDTEIRELESSVRISDRRLFRSWEALKDSTDPAAFETLLEEVRNKQTALDCLVRLIECRRSNVSHAPPHPLPPPNNDSEDGAEDSSLNMSGGRRRFDAKRSSNKRRRKESMKEPRSVPLSEEPSRHGPQQVTLYIQGAECAVQRAGSAGGALGPLQLPARASVRDILFFTAH
ncbi:uncharacterized protein [Epargyreus clarus]|uniref:uncharacterized protein n=1 Tax=Epargyreus clarus TaxID=520877 RepID=UPI003C2D7225